MDICVGGCVSGETVYVLSTRLERKCGQGRQRFIPLDWTFERAWFSTEPVLYVYIPLKEGFDRPPSREKLRLYLKNDSFK